MSKRIAMIDDEIAVLESIELILETLGYDIDTFVDPRTAVEAVTARTYDLVLVDIRMPGMNGAEVTEEILRRAPQSRVLILTGFPGDPLAKRALAAGAVGLLRKPFEISKIVDYLEETATNP